MNDDIYDDTESWEKDFYSTLLKYLATNKKFEIVQILTGGHCKTNRISYTNALEIIIYVDLDYISSLTEKMKNDVHKSCYDIHPLPRAFTKFVVSFKPLIKDYDIQTSKKLGEIPPTIVSKYKPTLLPVDIIQKGTEMTEIYFMVYCIENILRSVIEKVNKENQIIYSTDMEKKINDRKDQEKKHNWLPIRGVSDIYYLDLEDLGKLIMNNWKSISKFFPDQQWITVKIREIVQVRNRVAHNSSYIEEIQKSLVENYLNLILEQIKDEM